MMGISIRAYAKLRGQSHTAVNKAIKTGRVPVESDGTIDPVKADAAWAANTDPALQRGPTKKPTTTAQPPQSSRADTEQQDSRVPSFALSRSIKEAYEAKLIRIEYEQKIGNLLERGAVTKDAFEMARRTRDRVEQIPGHVSATLVAMTDRRAIEILLAKELRDALEEIADEKA
ncbi:MAG: hypothetical protein HQL99_03640 [Magnetococcales bacterium]|nr:hypothetical protein [Magnetococcales bacterium]